MNDPRGRRRWRRRAFSTVLGTLVLGAVLLALALDAPQANLVRSAGHACGGHERWRVKTLSDPGAKEVDFSPRRATIAALRAEPVPTRITPSTPRLEAVEQKTYKVRAQLVEARLVPDQDIHLVVGDEGGRTLIVEFPDVRCQPAARSSKKAAMRRAREALLAACGRLPTSFVDLEGTATLTGVGFFDKVHGQKGRAANGFELHPVLSFTRARCERA